MAGRVGDQVGERVEDAAGDGGSGEAVADGACEQVDETSRETTPKATGFEPGLSLYQFNSCPFCARVRHAADDLGIRLELRDTLADADHARAVVDATGRRTVPVLRIEHDGDEVEWLPESADIVRYLRDRFGN